MNATAEAAAPVRKPRPFRPARLLPDRREEGRQTADALAHTFRKLDCTTALAVLPEALVGDVTAAADLVAHTPASLRGFVALALHLHDVPADVMRATLAAIAFRDHAALVEAVSDKGRLRAMCQHAEIAAPAELPDTFQVWRGVRGMGIKRGSRSLVWTLDRAAACYAATCDNSDGAYPLLLTATARREDVGLRVGDDVLLFHVADPHTDGAGGVEGWRKAGAVHRLAALEAEAARRDMATREATT